MASQEHSELVQPQLHTREKQAQRAGATSPFVTAHVQPDQCIRLNMLLSSEGIDLQSNGYSILLLLVFSGNRRKLESSAERRITTI